TEEVITSEEEILNEVEYDVTDPSPESTDLVDEAQTDPARPNLSTELVAWSAKHGCKRQWFNDLLEILRRQGHKLPKDCRTLLQTPNKVQISDKCGGQYIYFGLKKGILKNISSSKTFQEGMHSVDLCINVDGVPLFKSTSVQFWPILCSFHQFEPFIVALFCGGSKPESVDDYVSDFLEELKLLTNNGIHFEDRVFNVTVKAFICDAPARSYLKCCKGHNSYFGCERCKIKGSWEGRVVFTGEEACNDRTDEQFKNFEYKEHQQRLSPLAAAGIGCISQFSLDYMHLACLGVGKRILIFLKQGPPKCRLSVRQRKEISDNLEILSGNNVVSKELYTHFLMLTVALSVMLDSDERKRNAYLNYAQKLLDTFVDNAQHLYRPTFVIYNVHSLRHLHQDVVQFNCSLNYVSAFPFENFLQSLKKLVRNSHNPIAQVVKRMKEKERVQSNCEASGSRMYILSRQKDCCFLLDNEDFAFVKEKRADRSLLCDVVRQTQTCNFFTEPCESQLFNTVYVNSLEIFLQPFKISQFERSSKVTDQEECLVELTQLFKYA
uniref:Transposase domain-containing protein n=1 Tax=Lepisosteus oculatus TaxID=7918 RepID=W5MYB2_LEPOC